MFCNLLRTVTFCVLFILSLIAFAAVIPVVFLREKWTAKVSVKFFECVEFLVRSVLKITVKVEGEENTPVNEGFVIASKHFSAWETFFFAHYFKGPHLIAKRILFWVPIFGWYMKRSGLIVGINRKNGPESRALISRASKEILNAGERIVIFLQGTRVPFDGRYNLQKYPYKKGILSICAEAPNVAVLPVTHNAGKYFGRGVFSLKKPGVITVRLMPVIRFAGEAPEFLQNLQNVIEENTNKIL